jgi:two-component system sensor histidine kinase KdpD
MVSHGVSHAAAARLTALLPGMLASAGVFVCTWISFRFGQSLGSAGFLYLVFVVLAAVYGGFRQATLVSIISVCCLDYFFDEPVFSFRIDRASDWIELGAFEFTALIISQLSNRARLRELEAVGERRDTARLYEVARRILLLDSVGDPGNLVTSLIQQVFEVRHVVLFEALSGRTYESSGSIPAADRQTILSQTRDAYFRDSDDCDLHTNRRFCVLRLGVRSIGALALCGAEIKPLVATALASLAAIAVERARTHEKQCEAEAARQVEQLRTAVLDALAHKFKTPLTVIRTANSGLPAAGGLSALQTELVGLIDRESSKLNDLASKLVGAPKLDAEEFDPQPEPLLFSRLIKAAVEELEQESDRKRFQILAPGSEPAILADRELILTALAQLVENALKYSEPQSPIDVSFVIRERAVVLRLRSRGLIVSAEDRERIFERFYRAPGARLRSAGTGLGLSIVKTIAADHHGSVWAEGEPNRGTVFSLSLPIVSDEVPSQVP